MHFPLFVELGDRPCLVVGGGKVAVRKAAMLRGFGAAVTVVAPTLNGQDARSPMNVAPEVCEELSTALEGSRLLSRAFLDADVEGQALVVAATDDAWLNAHVAALCKARGIPVNVVDDPPNCTFIFPAVFRKGPIVAAVSSGGASPVAAKLVRDKVSRLVTDDFVAAVESQGARRQELKKNYPDPQKRRRVCEEELAKWKD